MAAEPGQQHVFAVAHGGARNARHNPEDGAQSVVYAVNGVANPRAGLLAALVALGQQLVQHLLGLDLGRARRRLVVAAQERPQFAVVVLLVLNHLVEDGDGAFVAQRLQLLAVVGDVAAFLNLQPAQGHADAAGAVGQRIGLAAGAALVDRLGAAQLLDAFGPQHGVLQLGRRQVAQHLCADRLGIAVGQRLVGVEALHLRLPVAFKRRKNLFCPGPAH